GAKKFEGKLPPGVKLDKKWVGKVKPLSLEEAFKKADRDGDGKLNKEEFRAYYSRMPLPKGKAAASLADQVFAKMDANGDGFITLDEMKQYNAKVKESFLKAKASGKKKPPTDRGGGGQVGGRRGRPGRSFCCAQCPLAAGVPAAWVAERGAPGFVTSSLGMRIM